MKIERNAPPFYPLTITIESEEEQRALWFLGCSGHVTLAHYHTFKGPVPTGASGEVLREVLDKFADLVV